MNLPLRHRQQHHARGMALLALAGALVPARPRTAVWLATQEPSIRELQRALRLGRKVLRPEVAWMAAGALAASTYVSTRRTLRAHLSV